MYVVYWVHGSYFLQIHANKLLLCKAIMVLPPDNRQFSPTIGSGLGWGRLILGLGAHTVPATVSRPQWKHARTPCLHSIWHSMTTSVTASTFPTTATTPRESRSSTRVWCPGCSLKLSAKTSCIIPMWNEPRIDIFMRWFKVFQVGVVEVFINVCFRSYLVYTGKYYVLERKYN